MNKPISERHAPTEGKQEVRPVELPLMDVTNEDCVTAMKRQEAMGEEFETRAERDAVEALCCRERQFREYLRSAAVSASPLPVAPLDSGLAAVNEAYANRVVDLVNQVKRLTEAINWACGCGKQAFVPPTGPLAVPHYWWRAPLTQIGGLTWSPEEQSYVLAEKEDSHA